MAAREYGQREPMEDPTMVGTLEAQAQMIWPFEKPLLEKLGFGVIDAVADLGCGTGEFAGRLAEAWPTLNIEGLDTFEGHLAIAREKFPAARYPNLEFIHGDARATGWAEGRFEAVTIRHVLHALPDVDLVLEEAMRLLEPGGLLYVLAEDYAGLIFDTPGEPAQRLFFDAMPALMPHGTNLFHGRAVFRELRRAGFVDVHAEPLVIDTSNTPRETFARMLRFWRDGYADFIANSGDFNPRDIRDRFDSIIETVLDPERYACWVLFAVSGRRKGA